MAVTLALEVLMQTYTEMFFWTRTHTELCALATKLTGKLHTITYKREDLVNIIKEADNVH